MGWLGQVVLWGVAWEPSFPTPSGLGIGQAGSPGQHPCRLPSPLPAQGPAFSSPLCTCPAPLPSPPGCRAPALGLCFHAWHCQPPCLAYRASALLLAVTPIPSSPGYPQKPCRVLTTGLRACNTCSGWALPQGNHYLLTLISSALLLLQSWRGQGTNSHLSVLELSPCPHPCMTLCPLHAQPCIKHTCTHVRSHVHSHTHAHTHIALSHKKPAEDPHRWASRFSLGAQGF